MTEATDTSIHAVRGRYPLTGPQHVKVAVKRVLGLHGVRRVKVVGGPARGVTMTLDFAGHTPMYLGMYEWELHRFTREALPGAALVLDVGGYVGYDALMFAANCAGRVVTFEPDAERRPALHDNLAANPELAARITVDPSRVGAVAGAGTTTIDRVSRELGPPDFVKIDIDGGEADALRGAAATLRDRRPHLIVETHSRDLELECGALLVEAGYRPVIKHNRRVWKEHRGGAPHNRWLLAAGRS